MRKRIELPNYPSKTTTPVNPSYERTRIAELEAENAALKFGEREFRDKANEKTAEADKLAAENERLRAALEAVVRGWDVLKSIGITLHTDLERQVRAALSEEPAK